MKSLAGEDPVKCRGPASEYDVRDSFAATGAATVYYGTADVVVIHGNVADLVHYKSGADDRDHRAQLAGYALALFNMRARVKTIRCHALYGRVRRWIRGLSPRPTLPAWCSRSSKQGRISAGCPCRVITAPSAADRMVLPRPDYAGGRGGQGERELESLVPALKDPGAITDPATMAKALTLARFVSTWSDSVRKAATDLARRSRHAARVQAPGTPREPRDHRHPGCGGAI